jgi:hypothetical protein
VASINEFFFKHSRAILAAANGFSFARVYIAAQWCFGCRREPIPSLVASGGT